MSPRIENNRLLLRPWQDDDAPLLYQYASDPDVGPRAGWAPHQSVEESLHIIQTVFRNPTTWAIIRKEDNLLVGAIGYGPSCDCHLPAREGEPTVGDGVAQPRWNQGCSSPTSANKTHSPPLRGPQKSLILGVLSRGSRRGSSPPLSAGIS